MELFHVGSFITCFLLTCSDAASMFGEILSPNYPQAYPNDTLESWEISVPPGYGIRLYFTHLDIEPSQNCEYDSVKVLTGDHLEGQLCGRKKKKDHPPASHILKEFYVPDNTLTVTFQSDFSNEELFTGFAAYYVAVDVDECTEFVEKACSHYCNNYIGGYFCTCPPPYILYEDRKTCGVNCSGNVFTEPTGEITSPSYPGPYSENLHCGYYVVLEPGYHVVLTIEKKGFDTEPADLEGNCSNALTVSAGDQRFGPFCGNTFTGPSEIKVQNSSLKIDVRTNKYTQGKGWEIRYFGDPVPCPQNVTENSVLDPKRERHVFKDSVTVTCMEGYEIVTPQSSFTSFNSSCQSNGEWRDTHLRCEPAECGAPDDVENADVHYITGPGKTQYQAEIRYDCHTYYAPRKNGSRIYRCSATGRWVDENQKTELPACIPVCGKPDNPIEKVQRIIGGSTAQPGSFPWQAKIVISGLGRAGGALLGDRWILTAAYTLYPKRQAEYGPRQSLEEMAERVQVFLGSIHVTELHRLGNKSVLRLFVHPDYNPDNEQNFDGDIALIELRDPVTLGRDVLPICLPDPQNTSFYGRGRVGYASGFGVEKHHLADRLKYAMIPMADRASCQEWLRGKKIQGKDPVFSGNMFCAGSPREGTDTCQGDAGGAYTVLDPETGRWVATGIVSWGLDCGKGYGFYTKVVNYLDWIKGIVEQNWV